MGVPLSDRFHRSVDRGEVIGSIGPGGVTRLGIDVERTLEIDSGGLRVHTMAEPGWGRTALAYGPFERRAGRLVHVHLLNGHNTSDSSAVGSVWRRSARWLRGSGSESPAQRALRYPRSRPRESFPRKLRYWWVNRHERADPLSENLSVGWSAGPTPLGPMDGCSTHVVRATGPHNGELTTTVAGNLLPSFKGLQNLPVHYVSILRETGVLHLVASDYDGARGLPRHPRYRPVALDPSPLPQHVHAGFQQGATGQIGFSCDSRVFAVDVLDDPTFTHWFTTAAIADSFTDPQPGDPLRRAERGGTWTVTGEVDAGPLGLSIAGGGPPRGARRAELELPGHEGPLGLLHLLVDGLISDERLVLRWNLLGASHHAWVELTASGVGVGEATASRSVAAGRWQRSMAGAHAVQITDDGATVAVAIDGQEVGRVPFGAGADNRCGSQPVGRGIRLELHGTGELRVRELEAHARTVELAIIPAPTVTAVALGGEAVYDERFESVRDDLQERVARDTLPWVRIQGTGRIEVPIPGGARFAANVGTPMPDRTIYALDWPDPGYCDLELHAAAPVRGSTAGQRCRAGLSVWQDDRNHFAVNIYLDEAYPAASASTFFTFRGFEDIYDAVWSNLGDLVVWDRPFTLRLVCDGSRYVVLVNGEPVLHRAFQDVHPSTQALAVRKVGIVSAWEWGHDTGSTLHHFVARGRRTATDPLESTASPS